MTKPPYPTEIEFFKQSVAALNIFPFEDPPIDAMIGLSASEMMKLKESISYWLTPRKCLEVPPQVPCLARAYDWDYWILLENDQGDEYGFADSYSVPKDKVTHWLPLPPAPEES